jgi:hypothetical protein
VSFGVLCGQSDILMPTVFMRIAEYSQNFLSAFTRSSAYNNNNNIVVQHPLPSDHGLDLNLDAACSQYAASPLKVAQKRPCC